MVHAAVWSGVVWSGVVWYGVVWSGVVRGVYIFTNTHAWVDMRWTLVVMRWIWLEMGRTCGGHWWTWGGHAVDIGGHAKNLRGISPRFYCDAIVVALMRSILQASHALAACT